MSILGYSAFILYMLWVILASKSVVDNLSQCSSPDVEAKARFCCAWSQKLIGPRHFQVAADPPYVWRSGSVYHRIKETS